jgi:hypothetical protein
MRTPTEQLQPVSVQPLGHRLAPGPDCMPAPFPPVMRKRQLQAAADRHAELSAAAAALAYLYEHRSTGDPSEAAALAAAADLLAGYVRRALHQQPHRRQPPTRPGPNRQLPRGPGR